MFNQIDVSGSNVIEYDEFLISCIQENTLLTNENLAVVFNIFDRDYSG